jgi:hypothetical protein
VITTTLAMGFTILMTIALRRIYKTETAPKTRTACREPR